MHINNLLIFSKYVAKSFLDKESSCCCYQAIYEIRTWSTYIHFDRNKYCFKLINFFNILFRNYQAFRNLRLIKNICKWIFKIFLQALVEISRYKFIFNVQILIKYIQHLDELQSILQLWLLFWIIYGNMPYKFQENKSFYKYGLEVRNYFQVFHAHKYVDIYSMLYVTIAKTQFYVLKL